MHDCFTRQLKDGARPIDTDPAVLVSPCDAIVGASGTVNDGQVLQIKGFPYALADLLGDAAHAADVSQRLLRDAAADIQHVSSLSCAA